VLTISYAIEKRTTTKNNVNVRKKYPKRFNGFFKKLHHHHQEILPSIQKKKEKQIRNLYSAQFKLLLLFCKTRKLKFDSEKVFFFIKNLKKS